KGRPHEEVMQTIWSNGRDNSRTPMQWDNTLNSGFTEGQPWMKVNPNYMKINVEVQQQDEQSIYHFYKEMIQLRKDNPVFIYGDYDIQQEDHPGVYLYTRSMEGQFAVVICNFRGNEEKVQHIHLPEEKVELVLCNYEDTPSRLAEEATLRPYEVRVYI